MENVPEIQLYNFAEDRESRSFDPVHIQSIMWILLDLAILVLEAFLVIYRNVYIRSKNFIQQRCSADSQLSNEWSMSSWNFSYADICLKYQNITKVISTLSSGGLRPPRTTFQIFLPLTNLLSMVKSTKINQMHKRVLKNLKIRGNKAKN